MEKNKKIGKFNEIFFGFLKKIKKNSKNPLTNYKIML